MIRNIALSALTFFKYRINITGLSYARSSSGRDLRLRFRQGLPILRSLDDEAFYLALRPRRFENKL